MMRRLLVVGVLLGAIVTAAPSAAHAATPQPATYTGASCGAGGVAAFLMLKPWDACLNRDASGAPQIQKLTDVWLILLPLLEDAIKIAGYAAAGFVIWGGVKYIKSQGDPGQFNEARQVIYNALFGLLLAMISVAIVNFIAGAL